MGVITPLWPGHGVMDANGAAPPPHRQTRMMNSDAPACPQLLPLGLGHLLIRDQNQDGKDGTAQPEDSSSNRKKKLDFWGVGGRFQLPENS